MPENPSPAPAEGASTAPAPAPATPSTSLAPAYQAEKATIEGWLGDRSSPYWRGSEDQSAAWIQNRHADLIRAEQRGATEPVGPDFAPDADMPKDAGGYDFSSLPGRPMDADDWQWSQEFAAMAHGVGLGQTKVRAAAGWVLASPDLTETQFRNRCEAAGWSDVHIGAVLNWHRSLSGGQPRDASGQFAARPAAPTPAAAAARVAEIEKMMGDHGSEYWRGPQAAALQQEYRQLVSNAHSGNAAASVARTTDPGGDIRSQPGGKYWTDPKVRARVSALEMLLRDPGLSGDREAALTKEYRTLIGAF